MFREMRRKHQAMPREEASAILERCTSGVLALAGDEGYPYAVPLSYVYDGSKLYFHCAASGHKLDAIRSCRKASFCVVGRDNVIPAEYTTNYESVIVFGSIRILEDDAEKRAAAEKLAVKYYPGDSFEGRQKAIDSSWDSLCLLEMTIDHMTGKKSIRQPML